LRAARRFCPVDLALVVVLRRAARAASQGGRRRVHRWLLRGCSSNVICVP
jgi:hypothetical protein